MPEVACGRVRHRPYAEICQCIEPAGHPPEIEHRCACGERWPRVGEAMDEMLDDLDKDGKLGA